MPSLALRRIVHGLKARYHLWNGRRAYRAGRLRAAGRHLSEALSRGHSSFSAYLLMGKVAYREQDMEAAAECFRMARRADPARYAMEGFPKGFLESLLEKPQEAVRQRYRVVIEPTQLEGGNPSRARKPLRPTRSQVASGPAQAGGADEARDGNKGDFMSRDEEERLRSRPLLRPGEWADIDWDVEARKFFGE